MNAAAAAPTAVQPRPIGSFLPVDAEGHLVNDCRLDNVPPPLRALVVEHFERLFEDRLRAVYVRGSVARGTAVPGLSDLDAFAVVADGTPPACAVVPPDMLERLHAAAPDLTDFEFNACTRSQVTGNYYSTWAFLVKTQAVCIRGEDLAAGLRPYRVGPELMAEAMYLRARMGLYAQRLERESGAAQAMATCQWMMKALVRAAFDLTLDRAGLYTRDLYPCHATFASYYPARAADCERALRWAIAPTADTGAQRRLVQEFGTWVADEGARILQRHGIDPARYAL